MGKEIIIGKQLDWEPVETRLNMPTWADQVAALKRMTAAMSVKLDKGDPAAVKGIEELYIQVVTSLLKGGRMDAGGFRDDVQNVLVDSVIYFMRLDQRPAVYKINKGSVKITYNSMPPGFLKPNSAHLVIASNKLDGVVRTMQELRLPGEGYMHDSVNRATADLTSALLFRQESRSSH